MNTELDAPLIIWGGRIMLAVGIFGWLSVGLSFAGIHLYGDYFARTQGTIGLGAIIGSIFGGLGAAFVFKSNEYKKIVKEKLNSPCQAVRNTGKHDYQEFKYELKNNDYNLELPKICKVCGHKIIELYTHFGEKKNGD